ncbi:molybdopterin-dependent oxidoreductase [Microaerobacter geothermalis]|uniref:molybdopterin-dependent oxidoreductase n=1 Tax=Microaerobacter geothermalis TaxID=674972 RepID=UPI001F22B2E4|nr:molybdopterin-dependent oxidoreductase [Microaerobacter geothermalis]MCF6092484.1 molybdopterin-dependent oxidoreductase [Microaerobacter geothermalis]
MENKKVNRRGFLKVLGTLGAIAFVGPAFVGPVKQVMNGVWFDEPHGVGTSYQDYTAENVIFTSCEQCNTYCTIKAYVMKGSNSGPYSSIVRKIAGNQYSPLNMEPYGQISYDTPIDVAVKGTGDVAKEGRGFRGGRTCLKGQAGIQTAYDPYRVRKPLKRVGPRGSGKWKTITWEQAYDEIINGSKDLNTPGLKDIWAYIPQKPVMDDWEKVKNGDMTFSEFDQKYKDVLIDTKHPDFGPKANQIAFMLGDRRDFISRLILNSFGSINYEHHGGVCGVSSVIGNVRSYSNGKKKKRQYADVDHALFLIVWGSNPLVANKGPTWLAPKIMNALERGMKMAVIDPRLSKTAEKADMWIPIKPGTDGALALAIGRWIVENRRYDEDYLLNPNKQAAEKDGEPTWSDATHLVNMSDPRRPKLRASDLNLGSDKQFVVLQNGIPVPHDQAEEGQLEVDTTINGIKVKSSFTLYKERVMEKSLEEYAAITQIDKSQIIKLAKEFTSYGKRAAITAYRGPAMHVNGYYSQRAIAILNHLIGNYDWKGGSLTTGAFYKEFEGRYDLMSVPNANKAWGIPLARYKVKYEKTSLFKKDGYPAKRPWLPFSSHTVYEVLPSAAEKYPYGLKALFINRFSPVLSNPIGEIQAKVLADQKSLPLYVASDVTISDSSQYADYILPDTTYLERWGREAIYPNITTKFAGIYQPVTRVFPDVRSFENSLIELAKAMKLPGVGEGAFVDGSSLHSEEDFYLKRVANIAYDETPVPDASKKEMDTFVKARQLGLGKYFDLDRWKKAVKPEEWAKVVYVLNRGGRFEASNTGYVGEHLKYKFGGQVNFYDEGVAGGKNSYDGSYFDGIPKHEEIKYYNGELVKAEFPLQFVNWKSRNIGTYRTISSAWLREIRSDNYVWMNPIDAKSRGLKNGDKIVITAPDYKAEGTVLVTEGIRPGVVGAAYNFGQKGYGVNPNTIDNVMQNPLPTYNHTPFAFKEPMHEESGIPGGRGEGFAVNYLLKQDISYKNGVIVDLIGGSPGQLDLYVEISKA